MKFTVSKSKLLTCLNYINKAVSTNNIVPAAGCFLFEFSATTLDVTATNLELTMGGQVEIAADEYGCVMIRASRLLPLIKELAEQELIFEFSDSTVCIKTETGKYTIPFENGKDFPLFNVGEPLAQFSTESAVLETLFRKTFFAAWDDPATAMHGLCGRTKPGELSFIGGSRVSLSSWSIAVPATTEQDFIIPYKTAEILAKSIKGETTEFIVRDKHLTLNFTGGYFAQVVLSTINFPNCDMLICLKHDLRAGIDREVLLSAVKRVAGFSGEIKETFSIVKLEFTTNLLKLSANNELTNEAASEELPIEYDGQPLTIACNGKYLADVLKNLDFPTVDIWVTNHKTVMTLREGGSEQASADLMLVMPFAL